MKRPSIFCRERLAQRGRHAASLRIFSEYPAEGAEAGDEIYSPDRQPISEVARHLCEKAKRRDLRCRHRQQRQDYNSSLDCAYFVRRGSGPISGGHQCLSCPRQVVTASASERLLFRQRDRLLIGPGTLRPMLNVLRPTVGVVTLVALEHKSAFRTVEAVAEEKGKLVEVLPASGLAILNHDDPHVAAMAQRTKARSVTFGRTGGDYVSSNVRCEAPGDLRLTITHAGKAFEIATALTGVHHALAVGAAFSCTHQLGVAPAVIVERIANFTPLFARCSVHRVPNGPVFINDTAKAPYHSIYLTFDMLSGFQGPRKRIVVGQISDSAGSDHSLPESLSRGACHCRSSYLYRPARASLEGHGGGHSRGAVRLLPGRRGGSKIPEGNGHARRAHPFEERRQSAS